MLYWLRRNNIDKGPLTKEALLSQGLTSSDLIRTDGTSEWKTPASFAELQQAIHTAQKPKYKFTADKKLVEIKEEAPADKPDIASPHTTGQPETGTGPTPFKRMPSALPKKKPALTPGADQTAPGHIERAKERAKLLSRTEKPAEPAAQQPVQPQAGQQPGSQGHNTAATASGHQKVHAQVQSLEEAPLREHRHHPTPKPVRSTAPPRNANFFKEFFLPILIIGGIGFLAWWGYKQFTAPSAGAGLTATSLAGPDTARISQSAADTTGRHSARTEGPAAIPMHHATTTQAKKDSSHIRDSIKASLKPVPGIKPQVTAAASTKDSGSQGNNTVKTAAPVEKKTDTPLAAAATATTPKKAAPKEKAVPATTTHKAAGIGDYVSLSLNKTPEPGIKNVKIKVQNTSADDLNIAVIEVKYFDKDGKFIQGETLQTGKISAGKSATLKIPSSKAAEKISYKVSLISGDNVYLMGR